MKEQEAKGMDGEEAGACICMRSAGEGLSSALDSTLSSASKLRWCGRSSSPGDVNPCASVAGDAEELRLQSDARADAGVASARGMAGERNG